MRISVEIFFVLSQFKRLTDRERRTDILLIATTALHRYSAVKTIVYCVPKNAPPSCDDNFVKFEPIFK